MQTKTKWLWTWDTSEFPEDVEDVSDYWQDFKDGLTEIMQKKRGRTGYYRADGEKMGWESRSGHKYFKADDAAELLEAILPRTQEVTIRVNHCGVKGLYIKVSHHDAPMGENYYVRPVSESEYEKNA